MVLVIAVSRTFSFFSVNVFYTQVKSRWLYVGKLPKKPQ